MTTSSDHQRTLPALSVTGGQDDAGVELHGRLTGAGAGDIWGAVRVSDGQRCAVRRLRLPAGALVRERVRRAGRLLLTVEHPHLVPVLDVVATDEGAAVVTALAEPATTLERLDRTRPLSPGEVVTIGLPLARALGALHGAGLTHGRLTAADVLIERSGRVLLTGYGVSGLLGSAGSPADDVRGLAGLLIAALGDPETARTMGTAGTEPDPRETAPDVPPAEAALVAALAPALVADAARRPGAGDLEVALAGAVPPEPPPTGGPVLPRPAGGPMPTSRRRGLHRRAPRRLVIGVPAATAAVVLGVVSWSAGARPGARPAVPAADVAPAASVPPRATPAPAARWRAVLGGLDRTRADAFERLSTTRLAAADAPGSTAYEADLGILRELVARGAHAGGLRPDLVGVQVLSQGSRLTTLRATDRLPPYEFVDRAGRVVARSAGKPAHRQDVTLVLVGSAWRVATVRAVP